MKVKKMSLGYILEFLKNKSMKEQYLILIVGHIGSGKTTISKEIVKNFVINRVSNDDIRESLVLKIPFFSDAHGCSYRSEKAGAMNAVAHAHNKELVKQLLLSGESVLIDGGGITRKRRAEGISLKTFAVKNIKTIVLVLNIPENELLERLAERDKINKNYKWVDFYKKVRKQQFERVTDDEADYVLRFDHNDNDEIIAKLKDVLN